MDRYTGAGDYGGSCYRGRSSEKRTLWGRSVRSRVDRIYQLL